MVIAFLPRNKCLLISWLQSQSAVILEPKKRKSVTASTLSPSISHEVMEPDAMILSVKPAFSFSSFILIKRFFSSSSLSASRVVSSGFFDSKINFFFRIELVLYLLSFLYFACHFSFLKSRPGSRLGSISPNRKVGCLYMEISFVN